MTSDSYLSDFSPLTYPNEIPLALSRFPFDPFSFLDVGG